MICKKLNLVLTNGVYVVSAKIRKGSSVATLFITDFSRHERIMFDLEKKTLIGNAEGVVLTAKDVEMLVKMLG